MIAGELAFLDIAKIKLSNDYEYRSALANLELFCLSRIWKKPPFGLV